MAIELVDALHADGSLEMEDDKLRVAQALQDAITDPGPPAAHVLSHASGGADQLSVQDLSGVLADPQVANKVRTTTGPTTLTVGAVADGEFLKRAGTTLIGGAPAAGGGGDPVAAYTWAAGAASIDVSTAKVFAATNPLTANSTLTLTGGVDGSNGVIAVKHDGTTTAHTLAFTVAGRTVIRDLNVPNHDPLTTANGLTEYHYLYYTLAGTAYCRVLRAFLQ